MDNLKILSWNICWGCMKADDTSHLDTTAQFLAGKCVEIQECLNNVAKLINNENYDIIGLQEAAKYNDIIFKSGNLQKMGSIHHTLRIGENKIDLITFYNKQKFKVLAVKVGNIDTSNQEGRPYHIIFLQHTRTPDKYIIINLQNGRGTDYEKELLEKRLSTDINNLYIVNPSDKNKDFMNIEDRKLRDGSTLLNNTFKTIILGDFNEEGEDYWRGLQPFKHTSFQNLRSIVVSSKTIEPPKTCCTGSSLRTAGNMDYFIGDYILIDDSLEYSQSNTIVDYFTDHSATELSSDHKPVYAIIKIPNAALAVVSPVAPAAVSPAKKETVDKSDPNIIRYICIPNSEGTFFDRSTCESNIKDASVLPFQPVEPLAYQLVESSDIGDIANYAYIWFNNKSNSSDTIKKEEKDFIHETITKGTFPTYFKTYSDKEKEELFANEITFVRKQFIKAGLFNITILQIPRILYDLFNLLFFYHTHPAQYAKDDEKIKYDCNIYYYDVITKENKAYENTKDAYDKYTRENIDKCKSKIFELNDRIIAFLKRNVSLDTIDIVDNYNIILDLIMENISEIPVELRKQDSPRIDTPEKKIILYEILDLEKTPASKSILLYRGAKIDLDSTIYMQPELFFGMKTAKTAKMVCSISINLSILSGFLTDETACTINYMTGSMNGVKVNNNKIKYIINKFMFGDGSKEDSLFFIPPIPPYLQLYGERELWHPRTKIGNDALAQMPKGLYCYADFTKEYTYLQSNKSMQQLEELYQSYKTNGNIATWRKYIKYKTKYLELKNQLNR